MSNGRAWTKAEDDALIAGVKAGQDVAALAAAMSRTEPAIKSRICRLKIRGLIPTTQMELALTPAVSTEAPSAAPVSKAERHRKRWKAKDIRTLRDMYAAHASPEEMAAVLGRTKKAVECGFTNYVSSHAQPKPRRIPVRAVRRPSLVRRAVVAATVAAAAAGGVVAWVWLL
jgi:hypothetical protein